MPPASVISVWPPALGAPLSLFGKPLLAAVLMTSELVTQLTRLLSCVRSAKAAVTPVASTVRVSFTNTSARKLAAGQDHVIAIYDRQRLAARRIGQDHGIGRGGLDRDLVVFDFAVLRQAGIRQSPRAADAEAGVRRW